ncbi:MAG: DUF1385 domain-containing protein [Clostridia bacterium]|nr:DUF1385 domain-containing protein [Clostridia bacterium]
MNKEIWMKPKLSSNIGGEALIEGVMMRGQDRMAISIRKASGEIYTETKPYVAISKRHKFLGLPFIRGAVSMLESMIVGVKVLMDSAEHVDLYEDEKESKFDLWMQKKLGPNYFTYMLYGSVVIALVFGIGLFMLLPNLIADFFSFNKKTASGAFYANIIEGAIRVVLFVGYVFLVSKNKEIKRVFQYHGAEHKTLYAYENMEELTVENVRKHTTLHPRCGTTFIFIVILISIIVFAFAGWHSKIVNMLIRLALLPVIAGVSYELFKLAAKSNSKIVRIASMPGLMLQKITTQEPDDSMLEVAIASLKAVLAPASIPVSENEKAVEEPKLQVQSEVSGTSA